MNYREAGEYYEKRLLYELRKAFPKVTIKHNGVTKLGLAVRDYETTFGVIEVKGAQLWTTNAHGYRKNTIKLKRKDLVTGYLSELPDWYLLGWFNQWFLIDWKLVTRATFFQKLKDWGKKRNKKWLHITITDFKKLPRETPLLMR